MIPSNTLKWVQIPTHLYEECQKIYPSVTITDGMVCAGGKGHTTCNVNKRERSEPCIAYPVHAREWMGPT